MTNKPEFEKNHQDARIYAPLGWPFTRIIMRGLSDRQNLKFARPRQFGTRRIQDVAGVMYIGEQSEKSYAFTTDGVWLNFSAVAGPSMVRS